MSDFKEGDVVAKREDVTGIYFIGKLIRIKTIENVTYKSATVEFFDGSKILTVDQVLRQATPEEKEEFYRMQEETTEYRAEPQYKVEDKVLVEAKIVRIDNEDDSLQSHAIYIENMVSLNNRIWVDPKIIHSHAPKEPVIRQGILNMSNDAVVAESATSEKSYTFSALLITPEGEEPTLRMTQYGNTLKVERVATEKVVINLTEKEARYAIAALSDALGMVDSKQSKKCLAALRQKLMGAE